MRILYAALDQHVPGSKGGSIHVQAVAEGLAALGHEVHVLTGRGPGGFPAGAVRWHAMEPPFGLRQMRWARGAAVTRTAERVAADAVIERYYNFGGEGVRAAKRVGAIAVLEVNAPVIDYPGSPKQALDRALLVQPMRRWREWQCRQADVIVTPTAAILPACVDRRKVLETEWGADTERFHPGARGPLAFGRNAEDVVAVFAGAFRSWHGAHRLVEAIRILRARGEHHLTAILIGEGPELARVKEAAAGIAGITFTGSLAHERVAAQLAAADIGVAPFDVSAHAPLSLAFYWSPLKVFEYMASGLPVVAPRIDRLQAIVRDGGEGLLYDAADGEGLADALARLLDPALRARLGTAARQRAVAEFSWSAHCARLDRALREALPCAC